MGGEIKQFMVQLVGPSGIVEVNGKLQQFIEEASSIQELEKRIVEQKMDVDPIVGSRRYEGRFLGCWIHIRELPNPQGSLELDRPKQQVMDL